MKINYNEEDLIDHFGVSGVIKNSNCEILMQKHVKYGFWTIPVGKVDLDKDVVDGLKKEIFEECNIRVIKCKELLKKNFCYIRNGKKVNVYTYLFEITKYSGEIKNNEPEKHSIQKFFSVNEILKLPFLSDTTLLYLEILGYKRDRKI